MRSLILPCVTLAYATFLHSSHALASQNGPEDRNFDERISLTLTADGRNDPPGVSGAVVYIQ